MQISNFKKCECPFSMQKYSRPFISPRHGIVQAVTRHRNHKYFFKFVKKLLTFEITRQLLCIPFEYSFRVDCFLSNSPRNVVRIKQQTLQTTDEMKNVQKFDRTKIIWGFQTRNYYNLQNTVLSSRALLDPWNPSYDGGPRNLAQLNTLSQT